MSDDLLLKMMLMRNEDGRVFAVLIVDDGWLLGEQDVDLDVGGEDNEKGKQENLSVVDRVVDVRPVRGAASLSLS